MLKCNISQDKPKTNKTKQTLRTSLIMKILSIEEADYASSVQNPGLDTACLVHVGTKLTTVFLCRWCGHLLAAQPRPRLSCPSGCPRWSGIDALHFAVGTVAAVLVLADHDEAEAPVADVVGQAAGHGQRRGHDVANLGPAGEGVVEVLLGAVDVVAVHLGPVRVHLCHLPHQADGGRRWVGHAHHAERELLRDVLGGGGRRDCGGEGPVRQRVQLLYPRVLEEEGA